MSDAAQCPMAVRGAVNILLNLEDRLGDRLVKQSLYNLQGSNEILTISLGPGGPPHAGGSQFAGPTFGPPGSHRGSQRMSGRSSRHGSRRPQGPGSGRGILSPTYAIYEKANISRVCGSFFWACWAAPR